MVENWYLILNFLPWSRNFLRKNHDLYFKTQNLYYWKEIFQILYPRTKDYPKDPHKELLLSPRK